MLFINKSKNTIHVTDLEVNIPYLEDLSPQEISLDQAKQSEAFRKLIKMGAVEIVESSCGNSLFERNLMKLQKSSFTFFGPMEEMTREPVVEDKRIEVRFRGHFYEHGGYAKVNRNLATGLNQLGAKVCIEPVNRNNQLSENEFQNLVKISENVSKNAIVLESIIPTFSNSVCGKYRILYTTIEAETIPQQFVEIANGYNEIWVVSDFCKDVLSKYQVRPPVFVIPNTIDNGLYNENCEPYIFKPSLKDFVFISVFGWSYRKGYDVLLKAYLSEFSGDDPVSLLIMSRNHLGIGKDDVIRDTIDKFIKEYGGSNPAHIARCSKSVPEMSMPGIYKACDAYVSYSRGEAWGLGYCEAALCGLPVIGTKCSGQTMFLKDDNSYLLEVDKMAKMPPGLMQIHYWDGQVFPQLTSPETIASARKLLREVYENYDQAKKKNKGLQQFVSDNYSIGRVSNMAYERLQTIWEKMT